MTDERLKQLDRMITEIEAMMGEARSKENEDPNLWWKLSSAMGSLENVIGYVLRRRRELAQEA